MLTLERVTLVSIRVIVDDHLVCKIFWRKVHIAPAPRSRVKIQNEFLIFCSHPFPVFLQLPDTLQVVIYNLTISFGEMTSDGKSWVRLTHSNYQASIMHIMFCSDFLS